MIEPRFIVDTNVGHLARKLRMLGFDTLFINPIDDSELVWIAATETRILVSSDAGLFERRPLRAGAVKGCWIDPDQDHAAQLRRVLDAAGASQPTPFVRCIACNTPLVPRTKDEAHGRVPPHVQTTVEQYRYCPRCDQFFWSGSHTARMNELIASLSSG